MMHPKEQGKDQVINCNTSFDSSIKGSALEPKWFK
jgi:hypothetical protein